jgi:hypothetical protein
MECAERRLLEQWMGRSSDVVDFEVVPVVTGAHAVERIAPRRSPGADLRVKGDAPAPRAGAP